MGKGLAEFRKASDDFKRTWEREVALETEQATITPEQMSTIDETADADTSIASDPLLEPANPDWVVPRDDSPYVADTTADASSESTPEPVPVPAETTQPEPLRKHDWV
jgi:hypothetical protein